MSILIKGLEMPEDGALLCLKIYPSGVVRTCFSPPQPPDSKIATAIPISDHGDLIDRDKLKHGFCVECTLYPDNCLGENCDWGSIYHIEHAPTVIPAERSEE